VVVGPVTVPAGDEVDIYVGVDVVDRVGVEGVLVVPGAVGHAVVDQDALQGADVEGRVREGIGTVGQALVSVSQGSDESPDIGSVATDGDAMMATMKKNLLKCILKNRWKTSVDFGLENECGLAKSCRMEKEGVYGGYILYGEWKLNYLWATGLCIPYIAAYSFRRKALPNIDPMRER